jgi:hypothetical protein
MNQNSPKANASNACVHPTENQSPPPDTCSAIPSGADHYDLEQGQAGYKALHSELDGILSKLTSATATFEPSYHLGRFYWCLAKARN